jgi:hypothetical protein
MAEESIIARTAARDYQREERTGTLVLTTERVLAIGHDGVVWYEVRRSDIDQVMLRRNLLTIYLRGRLPAESFELASPLAGPVGWDWYLDPKPKTRHGDELPALAGDPRLGAISPEVLAEWELRMRAFTVGPSAVYLDELPEEPVRWADIVEIVYIVDGVGDGPSWMLVVRLDDGRWVYFDHQVDITGEAYSTMIVACALDTLWWGALTDGQRERLTMQITRERLDEELVQLDALLESSDRNVVSRAEYRMRQIRRLR